jgi:ribose/xylose/arabinose/galactoside ABC-type transport system permease subunit
MSVFRGISLVMNNSNPFDVPGYTYLNEAVVPRIVLHEGLENEVVLGIPISVVICIAVLVMGGFLLKYSRLGRHTYAIGSNREAAFHAGINVDRSLVWIYALTGLAVGMAAMITTSRTVSAQPTAGVTLELDIIAAVVIGGASLAGGRGTIVGTIVGTLLISFLRNGCTMLDISTNVQLIVIGAIIIVAVALDQLARSKAESAG